MGVVSILLVSGCHNTVSQSGSAKFPPDIAKAIQEFQTKSRAEDNYAVPRKLLPLLKAGLSKDEVREILGEPGRMAAGKQGEENWLYGLFYSQFISVTFDPEGRIKEVQSTIADR